MMATYRRLALLTFFLLVGFLVRPTSTAAAVLNIEPASATYAVGEHVTLTVSVDTEQQAMNAVEASISWDAEVLEFQRLSTTDTIIQYWAVEPLRRTLTTAYFSGGVPDPGYTGSSGSIIKLEFTARQAGLATVQLSEGKVLANDGTATSLPVTQRSASVTVQSLTSAPSSTPLRPSPSIASSTHPDQLAWSHESVVVLTWTQPDGSDGFSYVLDDDPTVEPDETVDVTGHGTTITIPDDGAWYFRLRAKYDDGWSASSRYILRYDHTPPAVFTPVITQDRGTADPSPEVSFSSSDNASGVASYTMSIDGGPSLPAVSPVVMEGLSSGDHEVVIVAIDQVGNTRVGKTNFTTSGTPVPKITSISNPLLLLEPLIVRGVARAGETITISIDQQVVSTLTAGRVADVGTDDSIMVVVPWEAIIDRQFRPGVHHLTATATTPTGQVSAATDPLSFNVSGQMIRIHGRTIATLAVVTPVAVLLISLAATILAVMARLGLAVVLMHRHVRLAEDDVERLRMTNLRQPITRQQLDQTLERIEEDLEGGDRKRVRKIQRRRSTKPKRS